MENPEKKEGTLDALRISGKGMMIPWGEERKRVWLKKWSGEVWGGERLV